MILLLTFALLCFPSRVFWYEADFVMTDSQYSSQDRSSPAFYAYYQLMLHIYRTVLPKARSPR